MMNLRAADNINQFNIIIYLFITLLILVFLVTICRFSIWKQLYNKWWKKRNHDITLIKSYTKKQKIANNLAEALIQLSQKKIGSVILIEKNQKVTDYVTLGAQINADIDPYLIVSIFSKNTPLHDGAIIIRKEKIVYASCYLPLLHRKKLKSDKIPLTYGSRHRATMEITNITDAVCFVTSETTGKIVFAKNRKIFEISSDLSNLIPFIMNCLS